MRRLRHPVRAIREPFGTAGLIVAIVALVAAVGGTAFAATKLNSTQKKEVEKIAKKFAGKPGTNGANGTNGTNGAPGVPGGKGDQGLPGNPGTPGVPGKSVVLTAEAAGLNCKEGGTKVEVQGEAASKKYVCNGLTGFTETLPSGETETGTWSISQAVRSVLEGVSVPISFSIPLAQPGGPESAFGFTQEKTENEEFGTSGCTGTVAEPTAPEGTLCVYTGSEELVGAATPIRELRSADGQLKRYGVSGAILVGASLEGEAEATAKVLASGSWAVTAP